jgi:CMP-2-keto-3-deoxyoctulosonic acid synthetase
MSYATVRIEAMQRELELLKKSLEKPEKVESIEGLWKGVEITEEDIKEAKESLFKGVHEFGS